MIEEVREGEEPKVYVAPPPRPLTEIEKINRDLADRIDKEVRGNPQHPYKAKFVGIANGQVVAVGDSLDEASRMLHVAEPDNTRVFLLEAGVDYDEVEYIWGLA